MLFDINGNPIGSSLSGTVGFENLSEEMINPILMVDENTPVFNLLDAESVTVGQAGSNGMVNPYQTGFRTSDYIPVRAGQTYVAQSWDASGNTSYDKVAFFDSQRTFVENFATKGNGTIRYCVFTPVVNGFIRYCYTHSNTANPMVFIGIAPIDTYVAYTGQTLTGDWYYQIANELKGMIQRDVEPSNIYGKRVYIIGDSNSDNWSSGSAKDLEKRYGCTVIGLGKYGARWATSVGADDTSGDNAIGQWNAFTAAVGIDAETYTFPDDVVLLFMMGTNGGSGTFDAASEDVTTAGGAINYIFKRAKYYGRNIPIGVFLPWCGRNNDQLKTAADYYKIPTFDIPSVIMADEPTKGLVRPDGTAVSQNYITDGGNHLASWGWKTFERIAHPWIAYQI